MKAEKLKSLKADSAANAAELEKLTPESQIYDYQRPFFDSAARRNLAVFSRQTGKDWTASMRGVRRLLMGWGNQYIFAPTERQSLEHFQKAKSAFEQYLEAFAMRYGVENALTVEEVEEVRENASSEGVLLAKSLRLSNGQKYTVMPGKAGNVRGGSGSVIITEFAFFENQAEFWEAAAAYVTKPEAFPKVIDVITTPNGKGDLVWQWWHENFVTREKKSWRCFFTDIHAAAAEWEKRGLLPEDYPTAKDYVAFLRETYSADSFAQEFECRFLDRANTLFSYELIARCESEKATRALDREIFANPYGRFYLGVDVGRKKDLTVLWVLERVHGIAVTRGVIELRAAPFKAQFEAISEILEHHNVRKCRIDATGIGMMLAESLREKFGAWRVEECQFTQKFKEEIFETTRAEMEAAKVLIPCAKDIREDLRGVQKVTTARGNVSYYAPSSEDGHSDRATALALAVSASMRAEPSRAYADEDFEPNPYAFL